MRTIDWENPIKIGRESRGATINDRADAVGLLGEPLVAIENGASVTTGIREKLAAALGVLGEQPNSPISTPMAFPRSKPKWVCRGGAGEGAIARAPEGVRSPV
jgi:hypothetical protein